MPFFYIGLALLALLGILCTQGIRNDYRVGVTLGRRTVIYVWALYTVHSVLSFWAAWDSIWLLPLNKGVCLTAGLVIAILGFFLFSCGIIQFRSIRRMSGTKTDKLITAGVYRWSRNPQNVGWGILLVGAAMIGRSGLTLLLAAIFWIAFRAYLVLEEKNLGKIFQKEWKEYVDCTARFIGPPK